MHNKQDLIQEIKNQGVKDGKVLEVIENIPREIFIPEESKDFAYENRPLQIGYGQTISQPYIVAFMTQALDIDDKSNVLEIGTGSGYQTSILAKIAEEVVTIECIIELSKKAENILEEMGYSNILFIQGDGAQGYCKKAPYDAILAAAVRDEIPKAFIEQLKTGGRIVMPIYMEGHQWLIKAIKQQDRSIKIEKLLQVSFVPFV